MTAISFVLNGVDTTIEALAHESLASVLRRLGMFSVKYGSATGETGAAAVLLDGRLASSDVLLAPQADGHRITTVEALNTAPGLHPIQEAFAATGALQSGYSAGAMVLGTMALLEQESRSVRGRDPRHVVGHSRSRDGLREARRSRTPRRCAHARRGGRAVSNRSCWSR